MFIDRALTLGLAVVNQYAMSLFHVLGLFQQ